jgi:hypothetical protein
VVKGKACRVSVGKPEGKRPLGNLGLFGRIIFIRKVVPVLK